MSTTCASQVTGQYYDKETGLKYNYMRDYDPGVGRFVENDPMGLKAGTNTYLYVGATPVRRADPLGLLPNPYILPRTPGDNTIVCDGNGSIVTQIQSLTGLQNKCEGDCLMTHESVHIDQALRQGHATIFQGQPKGMVVAIAGTERQVESPAYRAEDARLLRRLAAQGCNGPFVDTINARRAQIAPFL